ncbi:MAG: apolipoprotein N-acyltransferase [Leptospira bouyouniensis]|uniref:Apolipoprotein N-acyltransferase n=1 Tax=Leptospira bouyouniensis TaxID=2484911 RepID=A0ABY2L3G5_9LEPT|nr:apolipoprotein N-acyltransferase [Leptospira bouyouniensis]TGK46795.1 apolipoprotein N-acyltransferase [Leptospira bouyouniensis]
MKKHLKIPGISSPFTFLLLAAIFFALSLEPFGFATAGFLCLFFLLLVTKEIIKEGRLFHSIVYTVVFSFFVTCTTFYWMGNAIRNITGHSLVISSLLFLLYGFFSFYKIGIIFIGSFFFKKYRLVSETKFYLFIFPSLFLISDWISPMVFPVYWGDLFRNQILWRQMARFGIEVLGLVSVLSVSLFYLMVVRKEYKWKQTYLYLAPIFFIFSGNLYFLAETIPPEKAIHLVLLQPNTPYAKNEIREDFDFMTKTIQGVFNLGEEAIRNAPKPIDAILLPESSIPFLGTLPSKNPNSTYSKSFVDITEALVQLSNASLVFNELVWDEGSRNSFSLLKPVTLNTERRYKHILLPFGEYLPFENQIPLLRSLFPEVSHHISGSEFGSQVIKTKSGESVSFTPLICYEVLYPELVRKMILHSPSELIINLTNDSWFESFTETKQHAGAGRLRAIESGRPFVRAAVSGLSSAFDPWGRDMMGELPIFQKAIGYLDVMTVSHDRETPYLKFGPYPWRVLAVFGLFFLFFTSPRAFDSHKKKNEIEI